MKPARKPTYSVVAMVREDPRIIRRFIGFYKNAGAQEIIVYHDGPINLKDGNEWGATVIECSDDFWKGLCGKRPTMTNIRQTVLYTTAWKSCKSDWMLVVDVDEFVVGPRPIAELLASVPGEVEAVRLPTAEAVWGPGDNIGEEFGSTYFRTKIQKRANFLHVLFYGKLAPLFRFGLLGHTAGKHFVRRSAKIDEVGPHYSILEGNAVGRWIDKAVAGGEHFFVTHFDAISYERWSEKWRLRFSGENPSAKRSSQRIAQMNAIQSAFLSGEKDAYEVFIRMNTISRLQEFLMSRFGLLKKMSVFTD